MDKQRHLSAKNKTALLPNEGVLHAASAGGVGFTPQGLRITVGIVNRAARYKTPCVKGGTHSLFWSRMGHKQTSCRLYGMDWTRILFYQRLARGLCFFMKNSG